MKKVIFSGIQPSGNLHIGNYIGAIKQWVDLQNEAENELIFCIVDLHSITVQQDPKVLKEKNLELTALYLACGIDPKKAKIFIQSENPDHTYLAWIFDCLTPFSWFTRMTQFKEKGEQQKESSSVGLFNYPALMAADILLYDTDLVPVGEDQTQHLEITNDIAKRFNRLYTELFKSPKAMIDKAAARIMSLQKPEQKMSKSDKDPSGSVDLLNSEEVIKDKVKKAVTDSGTEVKFGEDKKAISNLLTIYSKLSGKEVVDLEKKYQGKSYGEFKNDLADVVVSSLKPIQESYKKLRADKAYLGQVLDEGLSFAKEKSGKKVTLVKEALGLGR